MQALGRTDQRFSSRPALGWLVVGLVECSSVDLLLELRRQIMSVDKSEANLALLLEYIEGFCSLLGFSASTSWSLAGPGSGSGIAESLFEPSFRVLDWAL